MERSVMSATAGAIAAAEWGDLNALVEHGIRQHALDAACRMCDQL